MTDLSRTAALYIGSYDPIVASHALHILQRDRLTGEVLAAATAIEMVHAPRGIVNRPVLELTPDAVQALFDQLWQAGFRPKDGTGNSGHVGAVNAHLQDMRKLAFDAVGKLLEEPVGRIGPEIVRP